MSAPEDKHEAVFSARTNIFYHERTERIYNLWLDSASVSALLVSSIAFAAFIDALPDSWGGAWKIAGASVALLAMTLNAMAVGFGLREKAAKHFDLKRQWTLVLRDAQKIKGNSRKELQAVLDAISDLDASEPAPNDARLLWAYHRTCKAMGLKPAEPVS